MRTRQEVESVVNGMTHYTSNDTAKAQAFMPHCHQWWLVVPDLRIARRDELPPGWGLIGPGADGALRIVHRAPKREPLPMPPTMLAAFARAIAKTAVREVSR